MLESYGIPTIKSFYSKDILNAIKSEKSYKTLENREGEIRRFLLDILKS